MKSSRKSKAGDIGWPGKFFSPQTDTFRTSRLDAGEGQPDWHSLRSTMSLQDFVVLRPCQTAFAKKALGFSDEVDLRSA
jgi:hypothetical protein